MDCEEMIHQLEEELLHLEEENGWLHREVDALIERCLELEQLANLPEGERWVYTLPENRR